MLRLSAREMLLCHIPGVNPELFDLREDRFFRSCPFPLAVMLVGVLRARRRDKDGDRINAFMKCTLDREDYTSLHFPFVLPYT